MDSSGQRLAWIASQCSDQRLSLVRQEVVCDLHVHVHVILHWNRACNAQLDLVCVWCVWCDVCVCVWCDVCECVWCDVCECVCVCGVCVV